MKIEKQSENIWNDIYKNYKGPDIINKYIYNRLAQILELYMSSGTKIIEAGCGSGYMVSYLQNKGYYPAGVDLNAGPLTVAKNVFGAKNVQKGDIFRMDFPDSYFDVVWNEGVLEHFKINKSMEAVKEMARVSKKYVIIDVPNRYSLFVVSKLLQKLFGKWPYGYEESYSILRLKRLMKRSGLKVAAIHGAYLPPPLCFWKKLRSLACLRFFIIPLPEAIVSKILKISDKIENNYPFLVKLFGFHLIGIGIKE